MLPAPPTMWSPSARQSTLAPNANVGVRPRRSSPAWSLMLALTALLLLTFTKPAAAALVFAPMCGTHAQSVVAPPISRAAPEIPLSASDCDGSHDLRFEADQRKPSPVPSPVLELTPRLPALAYRLPSAPRALVPLVDSEDDARPGYRSNLERPPRA